MNISSDSEENFPSNNSPLIPSCSTSTSVDHSSADKDSTINQEDIYDQIREQICYYFSESNLHKDRFMRKLIGVDCGNKYKRNKAENNALSRNDDNCNKSDTGYQQYNNAALSSGTQPVPLERFLNFNKIAKLTKCLDDLIRAFNTKIDKNQEFLSKNNLIFNAQELTLRRTKPFYLTDFDSTYRTIYIEGFDLQIQKINNHLHNCFSQCGQVLSVRVPRSNQSEIGFAFIEFEDEKAAKECCRCMERLTMEINNEHSNPDLINEKPESSQTADKEQQKLEQIKIKLSRLKHKDFNLRILSKNEWNHYKNRYLRLQKKSRGHTFKKEVEQIRESLELKLPNDNDEHYPMFISSYVRQQCSDTIEKEDENMSKSSENDSSSYNESQSHIVRLEFSVPTDANINYNLMRQIIRQAIQSGSSEKIDMPDLNDIAYIDTSNLNMIFQEDGTIRQTLFIRTLNSEAASKLTGNKCRKYLENNVSEEFGKILAIQILDQKDVAAYWRSVNNKKRNKKCRKFS